MDLRDLVRTNPGTAVGHSPVTDRLNVRDEFRRFSTDPLSGYLAAVGNDDVAFILDEIGRYRQAYSRYTLCLDRVLDHCSVARRWDRELRHHQARVRYSARQKQIAQKMKSTGPYQELDYQNLIIHACILLDRAVSLSRRFLRGSDLPSFTSFAQHKKFLKKHPAFLEGRHRDYAYRVTRETDWFEVPLKVLRDKYLMHSAERHMAFLGWSTEKQWDLEMITVISTSAREFSLRNAKMIVFSPRRLARDVDAFLSWFSGYARSVEG